MFIDNHCHLEVYNDTDIEKIIKRARNNNVSIILNNSVDIDVMKKNILLSKRYKEIKIAFGIYPIDALKLSKKELIDGMDFIKKNKDKIIAIGEVGIDLKKSKEFERQKETFIMFIRLSKELDLPLIVHSRNAEEKVIEILEKEKAKKVVMHCFLGKLELVKRIIKNNWYFSIPTNICYNKELQDAVKVIPLESLFCETDSPFLHPKKGERNNEPANVIFAYKKISEIKNLEIVEVEKQIQENFSRLFKMHFLKLQLKLRIPLLL
ncbi:MAG: TatD family hydrolase [Nanoarchaeota archaeon]|nr:TatD family hydrolase [Nanoarchaeota archaeon]